MIALSFVLWNAVDQIFNILGILRQHVAYYYEWWVNELGLAQLRHVSDILDKLKKFFNVLASGDIVDRGPMYDNDKRNLIQCSDNLLHN